jgi:pilus assembly protein Flp/PilA
MIDFIRYGIPVYVQTALRSVRDREEGQTLVEYALIIALISLAAVTAMTNLGSAISDKFQSIADQLG